MVEFSQAAPAMVTCKGASCWEGRCSIKPLCRQCDPFEPNLSAPVLHSTEALASFSIRWNWYRKKVLTLDSESSMGVARILGAADRVRTCDQRVATVDLPL